MTIKEYGRPGDAGQNNIPHTLIEAHVVFELLRYMSTTLKSGAMREVLVPTITCGPARGLIGDGGCSMSTNQQ